VTALEPDDVIFPSHRDMGAFVSRGMSLVTIFAQYLGRADTPTRGKDGNAHEMGHMIVDPGERLECSCGGRGHWEAYTSGSGLPNFAKLLAQKYRERTILLDQLKDRGIVAKDIFMAARLGDEFAALVVEESARLNAIAFANLTDLYDPSVIVVGGAVAINNKEFVVDPLEDRLVKLSFNSPPKVMVTPLGEGSSLLGAILSAFPDAGISA